ncbi:MAG: glycosyltransferase [Nitrospirota bacterium]
MRLVRTQFGPRPLWAWKDPRTTLILPLWKDVLAELGISLSCVYVVRNPLDVAKSLKRRDGFPFEKSWGLWLTANLAALDAVRGVPTVFVSFDRLMSDWEPELRRCAAGLGVLWLQDDSQLRKDMQGFLRPDLRHNASPREELLAEQAPDDVVHLHRMLDDIARNAVRVSDPGFQNPVEQVRRTFTEFSAYFRHEIDARLTSEKALAQRVAALESALANRDSELNRIHYKLTRVLVRKYHRVRDTLLPLHSGRRAVYSWVDAKARKIIEHGLVNFVYMEYWPYRFWITKHEPTRAEFPTMRAESTAWSYRPLVSLVTPVFNPTRYALTRCLESVADQLYDRWELCIVDGGSDQPYVREIIEAFTGREPRVKFLRLDKNRGIAGNANEALRLASGEYVGFLDHDDMLAPFALHEVVKLLNQGSPTDIIYSDEDKVPASGTRRYDPEFKSGWAPDTFLSYNYLCHFAVVRKRILDELGGFREGYDGAQDYDLLLRAVEKTQAIRRIPKVLYHWRAATASTAAGVKVKPYAVSAAKRAIAEHLTRRGLDAEVLDGDALGSYRVKYRVRPGQHVTIIVPTRDKLHLLERCVSSVLAKTRHEVFTILIVDNGSREPETLAYFDRVTDHAKVRVARYDQPFNFSAVNNFAVRGTDSDYLVFLNNDTEVINPEWLDAMLEFAQRDDVGAVGAKLYYPNDTIQHAGTIVGYWGVADHAHKHYPRSARGYMGRINIIQNLTAVTAACMMMRRTVFDEVGGFDEAFSHSFNDVDLCLRIRDKGYLVVYTPYAELYHHESVSRGHDDKPEERARLDREIALMKTRWKRVFDAGDPYYSPNLTLEKTDFSFRI